MTEPVRTNPTAWDSALTKQGDRVHITLPTELSRSLHARGFNRARVLLTAEGILLKPYEGTRGDTEVELPF